MRCQMPLMSSFRTGKTCSCGEEGREGGREGRRIEGGRRGRYVHEQSRA